MPNGIDLVRAERERVRELFLRFNATLDSALVGRPIGALRARDEAEHTALCGLATRLVDDPVLMDRLAAAHSAVKKQIDVVSGLRGTSLVDAFHTCRHMLATTLERGDQTASASCRARDRRTT